MVVTRCVCPHCGEVRVFQHAINGDPCCVVCGELMIRQVELDQRRR